MVSYVQSKWQSRLQPPSNRKAVASSDYGRFSMGKLNVSPDCQKTAGWLLYKEKDGQAMKIIAPQAWREDIALFKEKTDAFYAGELDLSLIHI